MSSSSYNSISTVQAPEHLTSLASSGLLVRAKCSVWTGSITDKETGAEVAADKEASEDTLAVQKKLLARCVEHKNLMRFRQTINNGMKVFTMPWSGDWDYLLMARYGKFMQWWTERQAEHAQLLDGFIKVYPEFVSNLAFQSQGKLFKREDYPGIDEIRRRFTLELHQMPVPQNDYRVQVSQDLADDLHKHYTRQTEEFAQAMVNKQTEQLLTVMDAIRRACDFTVSKDENGDEKVKRNRIRETTLEKALELIDSYRGFNPTRSQELDDMRTALEQVLKNTSVEQLRNNDTVRARVGNGIDEILQKFGRNSGHVS